MATYLILNIIVVLVVCAALYRWLRPPTKVWFMTLFALLFLTAIFDNVIIGFDIVRYSSDKILGLYVGMAPIEDFMYPLLAVIIIPALWRLFEAKHDA